MIMRLILIVTFLFDWPQLKCSMLVMSMVVMALWNSCKHTKGPPGFIYQRTGKPGLRIPYEDPALRPQEVRVQGCIQNNFSNVATFSMFTPSYRSRWLVLNTGKQESRYTMQCSYAHVKMRSSCHLVGATTHQTHKQSHPHQQTHRAVK